MSGVSRAVAECAPVLDRGRVGGDGGHFHCPAALIARSLPNQYKMRGKTKTKTKTKTTTTTTTTQQRNNNNALKTTTTKNSLPTCKQTQTRTSDDRPGGALTSIKLRLAAVSWRARAGPAAVGLSLSFALQLTARLSAVCIAMRWGSCGHYMAGIVAALPISPALCVPVWKLCPSPTVVWFTDGTAPPPPRPLAAWRRDCTCGRDDDCSRFRSRDATHEI